MKTAAHNAILALHAASAAMRQAYDAALELDDKIALNRLREIGVDILHATSHVVTRHVGIRETPVQELRS